MSAATPWAEHDPRAVQAPVAAVLAELNAAGVVDAADVHAADALRRLLGEEDRAVLAAAALTVRAAREGSSCLDLATAHADLASGRPDPAGDGSDAPETSDDAAPAPAEEAEPEPYDPSSWLPADAEQWAEAIRGGAAAAAGVLHVEDGLLYLDRYHREEVQVADDLRARAAADPTAPEPWTDEALTRVFPGETWAEQKAAVARAVRRPLTVLVGGPGTGKTSTVAGLLAVLSEQSQRAGRPLRIALAAPSGKAAARLRESVLEALARMSPADRERIGDVEASTVHRLLGWVPGAQTRFRHRRTNPLPHDVVVLDESSMLSLTLMARVVEALRPEARLVLVGDPDQLASVEAGAVLADLVEGFAGWPETPVARLTTTHRFGRGIGALADAVRDGDADAALAALQAGGDVGFVEVAHPDEAAAALDAELLAAAVALREVALDGDAAAALTQLGAHRLLCAHRDGPWGVTTWNARVERLLAGHVGAGGRSAPGRPLLVDANDYRLGLFNGDTGVLVREGRQTVAVFGDATRPVRHGLTAVAQAQSAYALTIHKSQGSQASRVVVLLPDAGSRLVSRELLYTGLTRAQDSLLVVGSADAVRRAVETPTRRASGLHRRLAR